jgi:hypothetical protein
MIIKTLLRGSFIFLVGANVRVHAEIEWGDASAPPILFYVALDDVKCFRPPELRGDTQLARLQAINGLIYRRFTGSGEQIIFHNGYAVICHT